MLDAFFHFAAPQTLALTFVGVFAGVLVGVMPGVSAGMLMALTLPFTFRMGSLDAVILLVSMFVGGVSGGLITATLMRIPGEPNAVMTCLDGFALARSGQPGRALGLGNAASIVGGILSWMALVVLAAPLAEVAVMLGPWEYFTLCVMALTLIAALSEGSLLKGMIAGLLGMLMSFPGLDETSGLTRLTFGIAELASGFDVLPVVIGIFALSQLIADTLFVDPAIGERLRVRMRGIFISLVDYLRHGMNMLRSSLIGIVIGILPGVGATIASIVAYTTAKQVSAKPESFGSGSEEAIVAAESANNATTGGTLIPLLTLGIPGGLTDSILLAALVIHNLQPGPLLYVNNPAVVHTIMATHLVAHLVMFAMMTVGVTLFARLMLVPRAIITPIVIVFCVIGAYAMNNRPLDVWIMLAFGAVGFGLELARAPLAPFVIGFILAPIAEKNLRAGLMMSAGDLSAVFQKPIATAFLVVSTVILALAFWPRRKVLSG